MAATDKSRLWDDYEQLRSYVLSPAKTLSRPLGLDLWRKKGFMSWVDVMLSRENEAEPARYTHGQPGKASASAELPLPLANIIAELPISLANIILEWSETNGGNAIVKS